MIYQLQYSSDPKAYANVRLDLGFKGNVISSYIATAEMKKILAHFSENVLVSNDKNHKEKLDNYLRSLVYTQGEQRISLFNGLLGLIFSHKIYRDFIEAFELGSVFCINSNKTIDTISQDVPFASDRVDILRDLCRTACYTHLLANAPDTDKAFKTFSFYYIKPDALLDQPAMHNWIERISYLTKEVPLAFWRKGQIAWLQDHYVH